MTGVQTCALPISLTSDQASSGNVVVNTVYDLASTTWYSNIVTKTDGIDIVDSVQLATKENSLGNPAIDGAILSSTAAGVRSWVVVNGGIQTAAFSFSSTQILNLGTAVQLLTAPGSGYAIEILSAVYDYTFVTTPYATNTDLKLWSLSASDTIQWYTGALAQVASSAISSNSVTIMTDLKSYGIVGKNCPVYLQVHGGNPTAGDGTLNVYLTYRIITL